MVAVVGHENQILTTLAFFAKLKLFADIIVQLAMYVLDLTDFFVF